MKFVSSVWKWFNLQWSPHPRYGRVAFRLAVESLEDRLAPAVLHVGSGSSEYHTIQSAVSAAKTGDIVLVDPGIYQGQVAINKSIELISQSGWNWGRCDGSAVIEAPTNLGAQTVANPNAIVHVAGSGVNAVIEGFTIEGASAAGAANLLYGVRVDGNASAQIDFNNVSNIIDSSNSQFGVAISVGNGANSNDGLGAQVGSAFITGNNITNYQRAGIVISNAGSWGIVLNNNIMATNHPATATLASSVTGVEVSDGASATVAFNSISNNYNDSNGTGVLLFNPGQGTEIAFNAIQGNDYGLFGQDITAVAGSSAHDYYGGHYCGGDWGSFCGGDFGNRGVSLDSNAITGNTYVGIELRTSSGVNLSGNFIADNGGSTYVYEDAGILLYQSTNNLIIGNQSINNNGSGIFVDAGSTGNTIQGNTFLGNYYYDSTSYLLASANAVDLSTGNGTAGTANTWCNNFGVQSITLSGESLFQIESHCFGFGFGFGFGHGY